MLEDADRDARERALDVHHSFLVQAPAGSGKTGLLIQRMLALLAIVERPEQVLAMTFTRKAAAEMRERVLRALRDAHDDVAVDAGRRHDMVTRGLARAALAQDRRHGWQLLANPTRLAIVTIDALAAAFARQAPITTGLGALPAFVDDASVHYREAVGSALASATPDDPHWRTFLLHVDNDAEAATELLAGMLGRRDQWRALPLGADAAQLRARLEHALRAEIESALARLSGLLPAALARELAGLEALAAVYFAGEGADPERAAFLHALAEGGGVPAATCEALELWDALANWLLVKSDPRFRAAWNKSSGFPGKGSGMGAAERERAGQAIRAWCDAAAAIPGFADALHAVRSLPPSRYGEQAWSFVSGTLALLPALASELQLVFARTGETDFSEATLRALAALGNADAPEDLLLAADLRIAHILVDEFQDTSWAQLELVGRLTSGWDEGDGRTLFAVGDPMQSIYRFREAEVRNFLDARAAGRINNVPVACLALSRNFRSLRPVVDWVNDVFPHVLGEAVDAARGGVAYAPVLATRDAPGAAAPTFEIVADAAAEAQAVVRRVRDAQRAGAQDIAILVRARGHLDAILPALRAAGIAYAAVDLESLGERLPTRDLMTLTRALTQPHDRIAALGLLRAPWCGLALADLLCVAQASSTHPILQAIGDAATIAPVSADGRARLARLHAAMAPAIAGRGHATLASRVRAAWLALGGPACIDDTLDLDGAERYFSLLARHEHGGDLADWPAFAAVAGKLFAQRQDDVTPTVQVMTLHKAKGLEFDTVILPGLARDTRRSDDPPLRWALRAEEDGARTLLLAPLKARIGARSHPDPVYAYLKSLDEAEDMAESGRLLYVGCTRAQRALHLVAAPGIKEATEKAARCWAAPRARSALARLWPGVANRAEPPEPPVTRAGNGAVMEPAAPPLVRLPLAWEPPALPPRIAMAEAPAGRTDDAPPYDWAQATAAAIGTVTHRLLAQVAREGLTRWTAEHVAAQRARVLAELAGEGVAPDARATAADVVQTALARTLADSKGRWLFAPTHEDARSEWALAGAHRDAIEHVTVDRTFVAEGVRWIVDYKTGSHAGGDATGFLDRERERYRAQLERYAAFVRALDARPIRVALYFPLVADGWRDWAYDG